MKISGIIWLRDVVEKPVAKHNVRTEEVEEVLRSSRRFRFIETGSVEGDDLYTAMGRTIAGRYPMVYFVHKVGREALVINARDMTT
ncbi:MAG: BrnT family toxin [Candidatus Hydrogenedentes bacterium]|nr:BrnT family toxin [Candidatus Hydrogenedentota bacterium]